MFRKNKRVWFPFCPCRLFSLSWNKIFFFWLDPPFRKNAEHWNMRLILIWKSDLTP